MGLKDFPDSIPALDRAAQAQCQRRLDALTKPPGSLGMIENIALQLAGIRGFPPRVNIAHVLVFAGDHGITDEGVSAFPRAVTAQMVANFLAGGAAVNVFSRLNNARVTVVDVGVDTDTDFAAPSGSEVRVVNEKVRRSTRNMVLEDAMTQQEVLRAMAVGKQQAANAIAQGADVLCLGEMGIGNTSAAAALVSKLLPLDPSLSVGRGTGVNDHGYSRKLNAVKTALERSKVIPKLPPPIPPDQLINQRGDPEGTLAVMAAVGGFEIAALTGACLAAASRCRPVLVDGYICSSAALAAIRIDPRVLPYLIFAHCSAETGHKHVLNKLGVRCLLACDMRLGEGTGAVMSLPLLKAACAILTEMATFDSAGVQGKIPTR